jgi:hypothetical protein
MYGNEQEAINKAVLSAPKQASIYERHERAVAEYHEACRRFADAANQRDKCNQILQQTAQELAKVIEHTLQDPTIPQAGCAVPGNGIAAQQRSY